MDPTPNRYNYKITPAPEAQGTLYEGGVRAKKSGCLL